MRLGQMVLANAFVRCVKAGHTQPLPGYACEDCLEQQIARTVACEVGCIGQLAEVNSSAALVEIIRRRAEQAERNELVS